MLTEETGTFLASFIKTAQSFWIILAAREQGKGQNAALRADD